MEDPPATPVRPLEVMIGKIAPYVVIGDIQITVILLAAALLFEVPMQGGPALLRSGLMFPFRGMPQWAQHLGEVLPLTHLLRIVRGILLKGSGLEQVLPELWQMPSRSEPFRTFRGPARRVPGRTRVRAQ